MRLNAAFRMNPMETAILLTLLTGGAFSYYQVGSRLFSCGRDLAGTEIRVWLALAGIQAVLFLGQGISSKISRAYWWLQFLSLPLMLIVFWQLAGAYPRIFVCIALLAVFYWYGVWLIGVLIGKPHRIPKAGPAIVETVVFLLLTLVIHSTIAFTILHAPGALLDDLTFFGVMAVSALIAMLIVRAELPFKSFSITQAPPLGLLILVLLRAKLPDNAYDSLFYKATQPIMIADWRTAITGGMDHTLLGTNFLEIMNSQLRILDPGFSPALTTTLSLIALWLLAPVVMDYLLPKSLGRSRGLARNIACLLLVSLSEMLIAAGTAYQEPMMSLLVVVSFLPMPFSWVFMGAAVATKITVLFILPLIIGLKVLSSIPAEKISFAAFSSAFGGPRADRARTLASIWSLLSAGLRRDKYRSSVALICIVLAAVVVGEQFYRNTAYTGRLMGVSEVLSNVTDPHGRKLAPQASNPVFDAVTQRGLAEKLGTTFVHVLTLDRWIAPTSLGFHVMPTSRLIAITAVMTLLVFAFPFLRQNRRIVLLFVIWNFCAFALLNFFSQGRHLLPLSIGAAILVALLIGEVSRNARETGRTSVEIYLCLAVAFVAFGDQVVGSFINNGWECRRNIAASVQPSNYDRPETAIERRLKDIVDKYRAFPASRLGGPPTIICEGPIERFHYLGVHYVYAGATLELNLRHLAANPNHFKLLPTSLLAICYTNPEFPARILGPTALKEFQEVAGEGNIHVLVSKPLMSGAKTTSLVGPQFKIFDWITSPGPMVDFLGNWNLGYLNSYSPAHTPSGKGAYASEIDGGKVGILLSPYSVTFDNVDFSDAAQIEVELAMPYSNSDGMMVEFILEGGSGSKQSTQLKLPPKPQDALNPAWQKWTIPVSASIGTGTLTIVAKSDGGTSDADWAIFRKIRLTTK
jgi:hypothetical protein